MTLLKDHRELPCFHTNPEDLKEIRRYLFRPETRTPRQETLACSPTQWLGPGLRSSWSCHQRPLRGADCVAYERGIGPADDTVLVRAFSRLQSFSAQEAFENDRGAEGTTGI